MKKLVMFSASWCNPCKQAKPIFEQIAKQIGEAICNIQERCMVKVG